MRGCMHMQSHSKSGAPTSHVRCHCCVVQVWFLGAKQPMPSVHAPVAAKAEEAILQTVSKHHHALLTSTMVSKA